MPKRAWCSLPVVLALALAGCGYVGDPLPPSLGIPQPISDLHVYERGDKLVIDFTVPALTTDNVTIKRVAGADLRIGVASDNWAEQGKRIPAGVEKPGPVHLEVPASEWAGKDVVIGVRAEKRRGRFGEWSNLVRLTVVPPLATPSNVAAEGTPKGVRVTWTSVDSRPGIEWRVFRRGPGEEKAVQLASATKPEYVDGTAVYGTSIEYAVQAAEKAGDTEAEGAVSAPVKIAYEDRFPPSVPTALSAMAGLDAVQLTWEPATEPDLKGYYVYRSRGDQPFTRMGELTQSPSYTDRAVESGKRYRYMVSAIDEKGNESARSAPVEATAP